MSFSSHLPRFLQPDFVGVAAGLCWMLFYLISLDDGVVWKPDSSGFGCSYSSELPPLRDPPPEMNTKARLGKAWIERNLPESQRHILETGAGLPHEKANLVANLIDGGYMDEVTEYMKYMEEYNDWQDMYK